MNYYARVRLSFCNYNLRRHRVRLTPLAFDNFCFFFDVQSRVDAINCGAQTHRRGMGWWLSDAKANLTSWIGKSEAGICRVHAAGD